MRRKYYPTYLAQQELLTSTAPVSLDSTVTPLIEQRLSVLVGVETPDSARMPATLAGVRALLSTMIGQQNVPSGPWPMNMNRSATRLNLLEPRATALETGLASLEIEVNSLRDVVLQGFAGTTTMFGLLNTQRQLDLAATQAQEARNALQEAKDDLQDAAIEQLAAEAKLTTALDVLQSAQIGQGRLDTLALAARQDATDKQLAVDRLDIAALKASDSLQAAQLVAQASGIEADRQLALAAQATAEQAKADAKAAKELAVAAQARADQAEADAQVAKTAAGNAQASANTANAGVAAATIRLDAVVASVATVQAAVTTAQTTANNAQVAVKELADKGRVLLGVVTPASAGVLSNGGTISVPLKWEKAFANTEYAGTFIRTSGGTAAMGVSLRDKTTTGCTLVLTYNGTLSLAVPAGTGDVVITHL
jgi:hypothetical protein